MPHQLIFFALERYGIDPKWIDLLKSYYGDLWSKSFSPIAPSSWYQHLRGIFTGCTVSIILFLAGMNVILEFISAGIDISIFQSLLSPPVKAFMDDLFLMSPSLQQTQVLLNLAAIVLSWARMSLNPSKLRNLASVKGKILNDNVLKSTKACILFLQSQKTLLDS